MTTTQRLPVSRKTAAAIALMVSGLCDLPKVARAVGLTLEEVQRIEAAEDANVRKLAAGRLPDDFIFRLRRTISCPSCGHPIFLVPCLTCKIARSKA